MVVWIAAVLLCIAPCLALPGTEPREEHRECDVVVLGAGLSGLSAAWRLVGEQTTPRSVCVLEANDRVGGRTMDHHVDGCPASSVAEMGAQWIADEETDSDVWDLAVNVLNLGIYNGWPWALYGFPVGPAEYNATVARLLNKVPLHPDEAETFFGPNATGSPEVAACREKVAEVYRSVNMTHVWDTPDAHRLDALTPLQWLESVGCNITWDQVKGQGFGASIDEKDPNILPPYFWVSMTSAGSSGQEIFRDSSALWWLHNVKSNGGVVSMGYNLQLYRIVGGPQQMSILLANRLLKEKDHAVLRLKSPVTRIEYTASKVTFVTSSGSTYTGKHAIVTGTPVALNTHITWSPPLPEGTSLMLRSAYIGNYNKQYAFFKGGPVWRDDPGLWRELSRVDVEWPMVYAPQHRGEHSWAKGTVFYNTPPVDNSPATLEVSTPTCPQLGSLFSFGWPDPHGKDAASRAQGWYHILPKSLAANISAVYGKAWAEEPYILGAYAAWWPRNVISVAQDAWSRVPNAPIYFAGSEWSGRGAGYMNGAIHNGRKHGSLVAELLSSSSS